MKKSKTKKVQTKNVEVRKAPRKRVSWKKEYHELKKECEKNDEALQKHFHELEERNALLDSNVKKLEEENIVLNSSLQECKKFGRDLESEKKSLENFLKTKKTEIHQLKIKFDETERKGNNRIRQYSDKLANLRYKMIGISGSPYSWFGGVIKIKKDLKKALNASS